MGSFTASNTHPDRIANKRSEVQRLDMEAFEVMEHCCTDEVLTQARLTGDQEPRTVHSQAFKC